MHRTLVLDVVGLTPGLLGPQTPNLVRFRDAGKLCPLTPVLPAVTCSVQTTFVTGKLPSEHGIVGNGWYFRDLSQVWLWRQSNHLVQGDKLWDEAKRKNPDFRCAKLFWWYNMYSTADLSITPRPMYTADGRKIPDVYTEPQHLRSELNAELGTFPLFKFWGPAAEISSSDWIARAAELVMARHSPTLTLVYLPHLDYDFQRFGPDHPKSRAALSEVDALVGRLLEAASASGHRVVVLSEYGITQVSRAVHPNRVLREAGLLRVREELGLEQLDPGASEAFAVADHQICHVYVRNPARVEQVRALCRAIPSVERVLAGDEKRTAGLDHPRSGELVLLSEPDAWFSYYFWLDDARAPDYARTVDIHAKPGYDPVELFLDPKLWLPKLAVLTKLLKRKLGFRQLLDVIPLDPSLVRGSHGLMPRTIADGPLLMSTNPELLPAAGVAATDVRQILLRHVFD